jgi:hypothetical protein
MIAASAKSPPRNLICPLKYCPVVDADFSHTMAESYHFEGRTFVAFIYWLPKLSI